MTADDWPQIRARLEHELALCSAEMSDLEGNSEGWHQFAADIRAALQRESENHAVCVRHGCGCNDAGATRVECPEHAALRQRVEELERQEQYWRHEVVTTRLCPVDHKQPHISHDCVAEIEKRAAAAEAKLARVIGVLQSDDSYEGIIRRSLAAAKGE